MAAPHLQPIDGGAGEPCFTVKEIAAKTRLSRQTITKEIALGRLKVKRMGRAIRIPLRFYEEWLGVR